MSNPLQSESASSSINSSSSTNNLTVQQILDCNQNMVSAMTSAMEVTINSLAERMDLHVNKLIAAVNSLSPTTFNNLGKGAQGQNICENPEPSDNSETGEVDEALNILENDRILYQEQEEIKAKAFLETPSENDPIFSAAIKGFSDSYNVDDEKWEQPVADDVKNAVMLAFNQAISEDHLKKILERTNLPDNCKVVQAKLVNSVIFATVSPSIGSTDIKLRDIQKDYSKVTSCLIQLLAWLPDVLRSKPNVNDMESKTEIKKIILDVLKLAGHGNQTINKLRKKYLLSGGSGEYKDLQKFAPGFDSHLFGEELEDSLKKAKGRHYSLQALKQSVVVSQAYKRKANADVPSRKSKTTGQPKSPGLAKRVLHKQTNNI